jgi:hypothetical protein
MLTPAVAFSDFVLAIHILGVVVGFGVVFAFPLLFSAAARLDPSVTPWLLRTRQRLGRQLVNPGLLVVLLAGIYLASDGHHWQAFYVQWGLGAVVVLGAIEGAYVIPRAGRLAAVAEQDLAATGVAAGGQRLTATWSPAYVAAHRRLAIAGWLTEAIIVVTVFLMATHAGT